MRRCQQKRSRQASRQAGRQAGFAKWLPLAKWWQVAPASPLPTNRPLPCAVCDVQHDVHAAAGAIEADKSALKSIVAKYNFSDADINGESSLGGWVGGWVGGVLAGV
jgi:hypothetical protein